MTQNVSEAAPLSGTKEASEIIDSQHRLRSFLDQLATPVLALDLSTVRKRLEKFRSCLPGAEILYAVKANAAPELLAELAAAGCGFDVASPGEIDACLAAGASPKSLSYSNPVKKRADIAYAHRRGVSRFAFDSLGGLRDIAEHAPGSSVYCRLVTEAAQARFPFGDKFGCAPQEAVELLRRARQLSLTPRGISFHVGSQQPDPAMWKPMIADAAEIAHQLRHEGMHLDLLNLGGGYPSAYTDSIAPLGQYATAIMAALEEHFPSGGPAGPAPDLVVEPGRSLVGEAGVLRTEVVQVTRKPDGTRWVFLDVGRYNGLAETLDEAVIYPIRAARNSGRTGPVVLAGPTSDGYDVLYRHHRYQLPLDLESGDHVDISCAGAYTTTYSAAACNGLPPLSTRCLQAPD